MFGKVITLNKKDYVVSLNEYDTIYNEKYSNLKIIKKFGEHERLVSFINEISNMLDDNNNSNIKSCNFVSINCTHGGYIPINISNFYKKVYIYEKNKLNLKYINTNIE